jgi:hypothetical protein
VTLTSWFMANERNRRNTHTIINTAMMMFSKARAVNREIFTSSNYLVSVTNTLIPVKREAIIRA